MYIMEVENVKSVAFRIWPCILVQYKRFVQGNRNNSADFLIQFLAIQKRWSEVEVSEVSQLFLKLSLDSFIWFNEHYKVTFSCTVWNTKLTWLKQ